MTNQRIIEARKASLERLRRIAIERGMSQKMLSEKSGISMETINKVLCGRSGLYLDTYFKILDALGMDLPKPYKKETDYFKIYKDCRFKHNPKDILG
jgi:transcriptional regulator with XRE-family HTH domain